MKVARPRLELGSRAPKAPMLDRYTTGLLTIRKVSPPLMIFSIMGNFL